MIFTLSNSIRMCVLCREHRKLTNIRRENAWCDCSLHISTSLCKRNGVEMEITKRHGVDIEITKIGRRNCTFQETIEQEDIYALFEIVNNTIKHIKCVSLLKKDDFVSS
jgi:hypothetical protein